MKVRFAPSPTGFLHIGGARTALFNWMYARVQGGQFVLRIEDTDRQRSEERFEKEILESMKWLGLEWDELYYQSQRFDIYKEYALKLLEQEKAYRDGDAIILHMPKDREIKLYDIIRGEITFQSSELKDQVLMKSDGSPAYSFCCVVDDALMEITHVIRGEDHISNTPKQIIIYEALEFKVPKYAHLPLIMGEDGGRMSKRTGAVAVTDYRKDGFLPEALVNYLMLLGWSPGNNQEMIRLDTAVKKFSIKKVNKAAAAFSMEKLRWLNSLYIKDMSVDQLLEYLIPYLKDNGIETADNKEQIKKIATIFKSRMMTLREFLERTDFMFKEDLVIAEEDQQKYLSVNRSKEFLFFSEKLEELSEYNSENIEKIFDGVLEEFQLKASDLVHPIRVAVTGHAVGPNLFEIMDVLGKNKTVERLKNVFK